MLTTPSPPVKDTNLITSSLFVVDQSSQNSATSENDVNLKNSSPNSLRKDLKRGEFKPTIGSSGKKRLVKHLAGTPSPLIKESNSTKGAQPSQTNSEGKRTIGSPLVSSVLAPKSVASSERKGKSGSPLASAVLNPRRGKAASGRPHQGVPFNVKPSPSPTTSSGMSTLDGLKKVMISRRKDGS